MRKTITYLFFFILHICIAQDISITSFPVDNQLYPRDEISGLASIESTGTVLESSNFVTISLKIYRDNILLNSSNQNLIYSGGIASFNFATDIVAELHNYKFELYADNNLIQSSDKIVAGDVFLFQGQSNMRSEASGVSNSETEFIRTFGKMPLNPQEDIWFINDYVGGIPNFFAMKFINEKNIPIAIINGALGGINISNMQRNDSNPLDDNTNYGQMLKRYLLAGFVPGDLKALVFYQGEANQLNSISSYKNLFYQLKNDWNEDYAPPLYYMFQVHKGCGVSKASFQYEAQRQIALEVANLKLISTNGVVQLTEDLCHFSYADGYSAFGERLYNLIDYEIYNIGSDSGVYSPIPINIRFTNSKKDQIKFELDNISDTFTFDDGAERDFFFSDNSIYVTSFVVLGNLVTLNLSNGIYDNKFSYLGVNPTSNPIIKNHTGIGMINFKDLEINDPTISEVIDGNWTYYYNESDLLIPFLGIEKLPVGIGANTNILNLIVSLVDYVNPLARKNKQEATFNLSKWWNIESSFTPNGWINIRLFYNPTIESDLLSDAITYSNSISSPYTSPILFIKSNEKLNPFNQLRNSGFNVSVFKCGNNISNGVYSGNDYKQISEVQLAEKSGITAIVKLAISYKEGTIRFNSTNNKFQGFNGLQWLNFN